MAYPFGEGVELPVVEGMMQRSRSAERSRRARVADVVDPWMDLNGQGPSYAPITTARSKWSQMNIRGLWTRDMTLIVRYQRAGD